jgi:processive 1,2-diacylglycerol beta-glucosyltransferase
MKPFLLPYVAAGNGHKSAALALKEAFETDGIPCTVVDVLNFSDRVFRMLYSNMYEIIGEHSHTSCGAIYKLTDQDREESRFVKFVDRFSELSLNQFQDFVKDNEPPVALCTHFLPQALLSSMKSKGLYSGRIYGCVTDFDLHLMWVCPNMDGYFVANDDIRNKLMKLGVDKFRIMATGIPVNSRFSCLQSDDGRNSGRMRILLSGSSISDKKVIAILEGLNNLELPMDVDVITGRNETLYYRLENFRGCPPMKVFVRGFVNNMEELMAEADLMVTKPGGLTISEALCAHLPMLLFAPIPFQETKNALFLDTRGAGVLCEDIRDILHKVSHFFRHPDDLQKMRRECGRLARPMAAVTIAEAVRHMYFERTDGAPERAEVV